MSARPCTARVVHINTQRTQGFAAAGDMEVTCRRWKGQQGRHPCATPDACELPEPTTFTAPWLRRLRQRAFTPPAWAGVALAAFGVPACVVGIGLCFVYWSPAA